MAGGRPSKYKPTYCDLVIEHMSEGASLTSFAAEIGVARSSINEWMENHAEFSEAVKIGKAKCAAWWEKLGRNNAITGEGNATLVIFGLKNMAPEDFRDKQEVHQTGTMEHKHSIGEMTDDELANIARAGSTRATK